MPLSLMYITNNPEVALVAEKNGIDRVWVDLETLGKEARQGHLDSVKSKHEISDIARIKPLLSTAQMLVRINPMNEGSEYEIEQVISAGADMIMLPMWKSANEVQRFLKIVAKRTKTVLLLETREAVECLDEVIANGGFDEVHIGLNDLHLSYGQKFMFELLTDGTVENLCNKLAVANIPYGFGGIARIGMGTLPAEHIIMEHYRLGSTRAILARSFCNYEKCESIAEVAEIFDVEMKRLRTYENSLSQVNAEAFSENCIFIKAAVEKIVKSM